MRARKIYEAIDFERGQDPKTAMDLGRFRDKNGRLIQKGDSVFADPESEDTFYEFQGTVDSFHGKYVTVRDMEDDYFDIEPYKLEILDESVSFERGQDPKSSMGIGLAARKIEAYEELEQAINEEFPSFLEDNIVEINDWEPGRSPFKYIRKSILVRGPMLHGESAKKVLNRWMKKYFPDFRVTSLRDFGYIKGRIYYMKISWKYDNLDESVSFERGRDPRASIGVGLFNIFVNNLQKMKESGIHKLRFVNYYGMPGGQFMISQEDMPGGRTIQEIMNDFFGKEYIKRVGDGWPQEWYFAEIKLPYEDLYKKAWERVYNK